MQSRDAGGGGGQVVALGEVMLRLDPGETRIQNARTFTVWEGGGEYNVARGLRRCFGLSTAIVTALADNPVGRLVEGFVLEGGVDTGFVQWASDDGSGAKVRTGLNFTERGFGIRGAVGVSDRGNSAASQLRPGQIDWDVIFTSGVRWFHTGGIFASLSPSTAEVAAEAIEAARRHGVPVSYDCNYRASQWAFRGGPDAADLLHQRLAGNVDVLFGAPVRRDRIVELRRRFAEVQVFAATERRVTSASRNDWRAAAWSEATGYIESISHRNLEVLDRVGSGDAFAAGVIYGLITGRPLDVALGLGIAHGALVMTTPGDSSMATRAEVERLADGSGAAIAR